MAIYGSLGNTTYDFTGKTLTLPSGSYKLISYGRIYGAGTMATTNTSTGANSNIGTFTSCAIRRAGHFRYNKWILPLKNIQKSQTKNMKVTGYTH